MGTGDSSVKSEDLSDLFSDNSDSESDDDSYVLLDTHHQRKKKATPQRNSVKSDIPKVAVVPRNNVPKTVKSERPKASVVSALEIPSDAAPKRGEDNTESDCISTVSSELSNSKTGDPANAKTPKQIRKPKFNICPVCSKQMKPNGFYMHVKKCKRYAGWRCGMCSCTIYSFSPRQPGNGPDGPHTLCYECCRIYKAGGDRAPPVVSASKAEEVMDVKDSRGESFDTTRSESEDPTRKPSKTVKRPQRAIKPVQRFVNIGTEKLPKSPKLILTTVTPPEPEIVDPPLDSEIWSLREECTLLLAALDNADVFLQRGPGVWMLERSAPNDLQRTDAMVLAHWWQMQARRGTDGTLIKTPPQDRATHVLSLLFASSNDNNPSENLTNSRAKSVALLSSGWQCVPSSMWGTDKTSWQRPGVNILPTASTHDLIGSAIPLHKAWNEHSQELRGGIEKVFGTKPNIPNQSDIKREVALVRPLESPKRLKRPHVLFPTVDDKIPKTVMTILLSRAKYVLPGDPRPFLECGWCGPKYQKPDNCNKDSKMPSCMACQLLYDGGWRMENYQRKGDANGPRANWADYIYNNRELGKSLRSVKTFLIDTSAAVVRGLRGDHSVEEDSAKKKRRKIIKSDKETSSVSSDSDHESVDSDIEVLSLDGCKKGADDSIYSDHVGIFSLPTISELWNEDGGLMGILKADEFGQIHRAYGSSMDIAFYILQDLSIGKLPYLAQFEAPFLRPSPDLNLLNSDIPPPTRYIGAIRMIEQTIVVEKGRSVCTTCANGKFGVEFPLFNSDRPEKSMRSTVGATVAGRKILIRSDVSTEDIAGKLYSFIYRILYGRRATEDMRTRMNTVEKWVVVRSLRSAQEESTVENA